MSSSYGNMTLRERITEVERKQRRSSRNEERSQDSIDSNDQDGKKQEFRIQDCHWQIDESH
ncbi:unnamed protein product [Larinioides sclopetarius]|uniref:Uncharacterized protein n=1 Tax=Larinioides sclopetarius TaxID=280406 RepID=A0AAV2ARC3_9ARAC